MTRAKERGRRGGEQIGGGGGEAMGRTFSLTTGSSQGVMMRQNGWNTQGALYMSTNDSVSG